MRTGELTDELKTILDIYAAVPLSPELWGCPCCFHHRLDWIPPVIPEMVDLSEPQRVEAWDLVCPNCRRVFAVVGGRPKEKE